MSASIKTLFALLLVVGLSQWESASHAEEPSKPSAYQEAIAKYNIAQYEYPTKLMELREAEYREALRYREKIDASNLEALSQQGFYGQLIVWLVILLVLGGFALSWLAFQKGQTGESSLEISRDGLKIRSPIIGLIVLLFSFGFFYLFITEVYNIKVLKVGDPAPPAASQAERPASKK
ncbi:MAG TPA: hypothetical protein VEU32_02105 [Burkholderiales bacterium]|nr:hypothetical protein [Burkholderiales bacterium]